MFNISLFFQSLTAGTLSLFMCCRLQDFGFVDDNTSKDGAYVNIGYIFFSCKCRYQKSQGTAAANGRGRHPAEPNINF